jgi:hypothetical protein
MIINPFLILDFDDVLFPKKEVQKNITTQLARLTGGQDLFTPFYLKIRQENNNFIDFKNVCAQFKQIHNLRFDPYLLFMTMNLAPYQKQIHENQLFLARLKKQMIPFKIITQGNREYQLLKLEKSGILTMIDPQTQLEIATENKIPLIVKEVKNNPNKNYLVVDDKLEILITIKHLLEGKQTVFTCKIGEWSGSEKENVNEVKMIDFSLSKVSEVEKLLNR